MEKGFGTGLHESMRETSRDSVYEDIQFRVSSGKVPAANFPDFDVFTTNTREYVFDVNDYINLGAEEVPHWWKEGSILNVHLHITTRIANATGANRFAKYTVYIADAKVDEVWTETSVTAELTIPNGTLALTNKKLVMGNIDLTGHTIGTQLKVTIKRIAATGGTEYADHTFITQCGMHALKDADGSRQETVK